ncbi:MAG: hypothetical protein R3B57_05190 [Phycisphaerales bacterium]
MGNSTRVALAAISLACLTAHAELDRYTLPNDVRVVLDPFEGADAVSVIAAYDTGFIDDPGGLAQGAHLAEHLRATGAIDQFPAGAVLARLNELGSANAETMADMTYYDYSLPADGLELALRTEAERLASLRITKGDVAREAPRAVGEVDSLLAQPTRPLAKFALMACVQGWRHDADNARVRTGLDQTDPAALAPLLNRARPANLTLIIAGGFDPAEAKTMIERTIARVDSGNPPPRTPIDWNAQPQLRRMTWDVDARVVVIACPPPDDPLARAVLTPMGMVTLFGAQRIEGVLSASSSSLTTPVGATPFYVMAVLDDHADPDEVTTRLHKLLDNAASRAALYRSQIGFTLKPPPDQTPETLRAQAKTLATQRHWTEPTALGVVLGNVALQRHLRERVADQDMLDRIDALSADEFGTIVSDALARANRRVVILEPAPD